MTRADDTDLARMVGDVAVDTTDDDEGTRLDRELNELLQELRVLLVAVSVVFGFLLGVPFTRVFHRTAGRAEEIVYFVALAATALSILTLVTPGAWHRLRWRSHDKEMLLRAGNRFTIVGTILAGAAVCAVVLLVTEVLFGWTFAAIVSAVSALVVIALWYVLPLSRELRDGDATSER